MTINDVMLDRIIKYCNKEYVYTYNGRYVNKTSIGNDTLELIDHHIDRAIKIGGNFYKRYFE